MSDQAAKLHHGLALLLVRFGRMTVSVHGVDRATANDALDLAHFVPIGDWQYGETCDVIRVRRKEHRFDVYRPRQTHRR
jgi:hypothetical protein